MMKVIVMRALQWCILSDTRSLYTCKGSFSATDTLHLLQTRDMFKQEQENKERKNKRRKNKRRKNTFAQADAKQLRRLCVRAEVHVCVINSSSRGSSSVFRGSQSSCVLQLI